MFYSGFLGEPYLLHDCLVYFDGKILYVASFPLDDPCREIESSVISKIVVASQDFVSAEAINIWGRFSFIENIRLADNRALSVLKSHDYDEGQPSSGIDLHAFSWESCAPARAARNSARNKGLRWFATKSLVLTAAHIRLIDEWKQTHEISLVHLEMALSLLGYIRLPHVLMLEVMLGDDLVGFGVLSFPAPGIAALMQTFVKRIPKGRIGDALSACAIETALARGAKVLHRGYSATPSLEAFKIKWQAKRIGPSYRELFLANGSRLAQQIKDGTFFWADRLRQT